MWRILVKCLYVKIRKSPYICISWFRNLYIQILSEICEMYIFFNLGNMCSNRFLLTLCNQFYMSFTVFWNRTYRFFFCLKTFQMYFWYFLKYSCCLCPLLFTPMYCISLKSSYIMLSQRLVIFTDYSECLMQCFFRVLANYCSTYTDVILSFTGVFLLWLSKWLPMQTAVFYLWSVHVNKR